VLNEIELYKKYVADLYKGNKVYTFDEIYNFLKADYKIIDEEILKYAMEEMVDSNFVIKRGNNYIYQDANTSIRASILERTTMKYLPGKLDIGRLAKEEKITTPVRNTSTVMKSIEERIESLNDSVESLNMSFPKQHIVDSIVDKLSESELEDCVKHFAQVKPTTPLEKEVFSSLERTGSFIVNNSMFTYFYNHFTGKFHNAATNEVAGPLELAKIKTAYDAIMKNTYDSVPEDVKGYIGLSRKLEPKFKVKDNPSTSGYVCSQTSSLELGELKKRVGITDTKLKASKAMLCHIYELQLRNAGKFKRPFGMKK